MLLSVRKATIADVSPLQTFLQKIFHETYDEIIGKAATQEMIDAWQTTEALTAQIQAENQQFLVVNSPENDTQLIAHAYAFLINAQTIKLARLYVDTSFQRQGLATRLLRKVITAYPQATQIILEVEPDNHQAIAYYQRQGFIKGEQLASCNSDDRFDAIQMEKAL